MKYAAEMTSDGTIYTQSFKKIGLGFQVLLRGETHRHTYTGTLR
jgi:hypothetical protein